MGKLEQVWIVLITQEALETVKVELLLLLLLSHPVVSDSATS